MMVKPHDVPVSGTYEITDRLTRIRVAATTFEGLLTRIYQTRGAIGAVSGTGVREELESWICQEYPEDCTEVDMGIPRKHRVTLSDVLRGTRVMLAHAVAGRPLVDRKEAERRAAICQQCEFNQFFEKPCTGVCPELSSMVNSITGHQGTHYDQYLKSCGICHCFLQSAIWLPLQIQCKGVTDDMKKQFQHVPLCWKNCDATE